jgi:protein TonB
MRLRNAFTSVVLLMTCAWAASVKAQTVGYMAPQMPECRPRTTYLPFNAPEPAISIETRLRAAVTAQPAAIEPALDLARCYLMRWEKDRLPDADLLLNQAKRLLATTTAAPAPVAAAGEPVRVTGGVPARVSGAGPAYPAAAQAAGIAGLVFIDAVIDTTGAVREARVVGSIPGLDVEAQAAVRGWKYAPPVIDGKPVEVLKLVSVRFAPHPGITVIDLIDLARFYAATGHVSEAQAATAQAIQAVADRRAALTRKIGERPGEVTEPVVSFRVPPVYPAKARSNKIQGYVIVEALVTEEGDVVAPVILKPAAELLNQAAIEAVAQWKYTPARFDGKPVPITLNVTVNFALQTGQ